MNIEIIKAIRIITADGKKVLVDDEAAVASVESMISKFADVQQPSAAAVRPNRATVSKTRDVAPKSLPPPAKFPSKDAAVVRRRQRTGLQVRPLRKSESSPWKRDCARAKGRDR